ncbi:leucyl aminopeptidase [Pontivivens insulae]|uniref:Probable cytosol aminopeptidase n=1 Tax=Pontivivens insulae TaxID=1639689 RepID=A0A2R8ABG4_9RHOB|nr:leucyl aminopeptidase [Pontivivens insulae]RED13298.1 leucyl aminopeptidase [Pontivivens insulae]SPF29390.1 Cytosol aminopeptidase [Pontivivens insulae]
MTTPLNITFAEADIDALATAEGRVVVTMGTDGTLSPMARRANKLSKGALVRLSETKRWEDLAASGAVTLEYPVGFAAEALIVVKLDTRAGAEAARKAGAAVATRMGKGDVTLGLGALRNAADFTYGLALRAYAFVDHKTDDTPTPARITALVTKPEEVSAQAGPMAAVAEGVFFTRDLINEPSNVLTTDDFAARLAAMGELGLDVEILEEDDLEKLGMRTLLAVGMGSDMPSKVVVMKWNGGGDEAPLALVGKGVTFDTGGISLKPAGGMEDMTMDMGGAGTVAGVMRALALRGAKANVVGLVGLVENMPSARAQRPGDVVKSMKGDTVEVINTDAEGRLVLCDVLWYAQERFEPSGIIDLATLTGAVIIALGHENTGVFSNNDTFVDDFLMAAKAEGEGAWRLPLGPAYDKKLKSRVADMKNVGGRDAGSITAAQFLQRFIKKDMPWIHLDIAGTASVKAATTYAPAGATGWGVRALDRLVRDNFEVE